MVSELNNSYVVNTMIFFGFGWKDNENIIWILKHQICLSITLVLINDRGSFTIYSLVTIVNDNYWLKPLKICNLNLHQQLQIW